MKNSNVSCPFTEVDRPSDCLKAALSILYSGVDGQPDAVRTFKMSMHGFVLNGIAVACQEQCDFEAVVEIRKKNIVAVEDDHTL